jgi:Flp pilus assembly protein TadB
MPLFTTSLGYLMLGGMVVLMSVGGFLMQRMIKLEV